MLKRLEVVQETLELGNLGDNVVTGGTVSLGEAVVKKGAVYFPTSLLCNLKAPGTDAEFVLREKANPSNVFARYDARAVGTQGLGLDGHNTVNGKQIGPFASDTTIEFVVVNALPAATALCAGVARLHQGITDPKSSYDRITA